MNLNLSDALAQLAQKLGTTADRVFPMLVAKAKFDALLCMWVFGSVAVLGLAVVVFLIYAVVAWDWDDITFLPIGLTALLVVVFSILAVSGISDYRYPEASALQSLAPRII